MDKEDPYFASLIYIISHKDGVSVKHLVERKPKMVTSIARYYIHYHIKRFLREPNKMTSYNTNDMLTTIKKNIPTRKIWVNKFHSGQENINYWYNKQPNKYNIRQVRYDMCVNNSGVIGIRYQEVGEIVNKSDNDWIKFIKKDSDGLTKTGQKLMQLAMES